MRTLLMLLAAVGAAVAGDPATAARAALEASIARQRAAVAVQVTTVARQDAASRAVAECAARQRAVAERQVRPPEFPPLALWQAACGRVPAADVDALVASAATREGVPPGLLRAVMERESSFLPCAVSSKGALGLMQLMPSTAGELGVADAFDPGENVRSGARLLARLLERYGGDVPLALGAYNAGPARVDAAGGVPDIPETRDYVQAILGSMGRAGPSGGPDSR